MADDLDDLLDEVETKYCAKAKQKNKQPNRNRKSTEDDLDDILNDITVDADFKPIKSSDIQSGNQTGMRPESARKCFPVYIGGSASSLGMGNSMNPRCCDQMRCTSCDFKVAIFDNFEWDASTDYLFLRNNCPDFQRLKPKLHSKRGCRAYCCQCCHRSISTVEQLTDPSLKWVCGKH
ncbi:protein C8orf37 homolog [Mizuhopecten yessoensis]|uniref:Cilia- and flagella-associated protein 418 n=1 Tax=Mizuhopecten yessoensis TaxID=6573 RepID=A0A210PGL0_MIZYE|nr:protein C8orf37 homolog [Mizuhopecten yessoensis]OWF35625.1 Protein C8orf37-like [Mizuhopecten yessoensis]